MEWYVVLFLMFFALVFLMAIGVPVAFSFLALNIVLGLGYFGRTGIEQNVLSMYTNLNTFILLPIPLFILMGEIMFHSGIGPLLIRTLDKWIGRIPGRLSLLAVAAGTLFATLTGTSLASVALLGSVLLPEMRKQNYSIEMSAGPILGSGGLAMMIPPSALAVLAAAISEVSVGKTLMGIIVPGLLLAATMTLYIVIRCTLQPAVAPKYEMPPVPAGEKIRDTVKYVLPQGIIIFLVIGLIFFGVAGPSESAAGGVIGMQATFAAPADGYTLTMIGGGLTIAKALFKSLPYDLVNDLTPVSTTASYGLVIVTRADSPYKTLGDVIAAAKGKPGALNFGTINAGSAQNLSAVLFKNAAGIDAAVVPFKTTPDLSTAVLRGDIDIAFEYYPAVQSPVESGQMRVLATTGPARARNLPNVPTVMESGLPGYEVTSWNGLAVRTGTPPEIVKALNEAVTEVLKLPDIQAFSAKSGMEALPMSPEALHARIKRDVAKWELAIEKAGIPKR
jgi:tripartite-type tricarboxylate transporter receptor subunit TctC